VDPPSTSLGYASASTQTQTQMPPLPPLDGAIDPFWESVLQPWSADAVGPIPEGSALTNDMWGGVDTALFDVPLIDIDWPGLAELGLVTTSDPAAQSYPVQSGSSNPGFVSMLGRQISESCSEQCRTSRAKEVATMADVWAKYQEYATQLANFQRHPTLASVNLRPPEPSAGSAGGEAVSGAAPPTGVVVSEPCSEECRVMREAAQADVARLTQMVKAHNGFLDSFWERVTKSRAGGESV
jgi:hypothetical protein